MGCEAGDYKDSLRESKTHVFQRGSYEQQDVAQAEGSCCFSWLPIQSPNICCKVGGDKDGRDHFVYYENFCYLLVLQQSKKKQWG